MSLCWVLTLWLLGRSFLGGDMSTCPHVHGPICRILEPKWRQVNLQTLWLWCLSSPLNYSCLFLSPLSFLFVSFGHSPPEPPPCCPASSDGSSSCLNIGSWLREFRSSLVQGSHRDGWGEGGQTPGAETGRFEEFNLRKSEQNLRGAAVCVWCSGGQRNKEVGAGNSGVWKWFEAKGKIKYLRFLEAGGAGTGDHKEPREGGIQGGEASQPQERNEGRYKADVKKDL